MPPLRYERVVLTSASSEADVYRTSLVVPKTSNTSDDATPNNGSPVAFSDTSTVRNEADDDDDVDDEDDDDDDDNIMF